jgi:hypothetical protein
MLRKSAELDRTDGNAEDGRLTPELTACSWTAGRSQDCRAVCVTLYITKDQRSYFPFPTTMKTNWDGEPPSPRTYTEYQANKANPDYHFTSTVLVSVEKHRPNNCQESDATRAGGRDFRLTENRACSL